MTPKPASVKTAVILIFTAIIVGQVRSLADFSNAVREAAPVGGIYTVVAIQLVLLAVSVWIALSIKNRKPWARTVFVLFVGIGAVLAIYPLLKSFQADLFQGLGGLLQMSLQIAAAALLLGKDARGWFKLDVTQ